MTDISRGIVERLDLNPGVAIKARSVSADVADANPRHAAGIAEIKERSRLVDQEHAAYCEAMREKGDVVNACGNRVADLERELALSASERGALARAFAIGAIGDAKLDSGLQRIDAMQRRLEVLREGMQILADEAKLAQRSGESTAHRQQAAEEELAEMRALSSIDIAKRQ